MVVEGCVRFPCEWNSSPLCYQWLLCFTWYHDLKTFVWSAVYHMSDLELLVHLRHGELEFRCQCLCEGRFHDPFQAVELVEVIRQLIVFDESRPVVR